MRCLFATQAEHKYKYRIETSKNNKKPTVPDRRDEIVQIQVYKKLKKYALFKQMTKVNVNELLHSAYRVSVTKFEI